MVFCPFPFGKGSLLYPFHLLNVNGGRDWGRKTRRCPHGDGDTQGKVDRGKKTEGKIDIDIDIERQGDKVMKIQRDRWTIDRETGQ